MSPASAAAGGPAFTLIVNGTNFAGNSTVRWNGVERVTTFVSASRLTASILSPDIAGLGTAAVMVFTPAPGGGLSNTLTFTVAVNPPAGLPMPVLNPTAALPVNSAITFDYPVNAVNFQWTVSPYSGGADLLTTVPSLSLESLHLSPGVYTVSVQAVDTAGGRSPAGVMTVTLAAADLSLARVFPNPWRVDKHAGKKITFDQLPLGSTVKIFTISGHWVSNVPVTGTKALWDLTNDKGEKAASGLYLYLISSGDGSGHKTSGKLAIIK